MPGPKIDRNKLRAAIRRLGDEYVFYMLDDAIDLLPQTALAKLAEPYIRLNQLQPDDAEEAGTQSLRLEVGAFSTCAVVPASTIRASRSIPRTARSTR